MKPYFKRMLLLSGILVVVFVAFFVRLNYMVRVAGDNYSNRASSRSTKTITVYGNRGTIFDTNMVPLAYDRRSYNVTFYRDPTRNNDADRLNYTRTLMQGQRCRHIADIVHMGPCRLGHAAAGISR